MDDPRSPAAARDALDAIRVDRARVGERMTAETWWAAPAQGFGTALLVAAPAGGLQWAWLVFTASACVFIGVELAFRKRSGMAISRPAGPRGLALLIALIVVLLGSLAATVALAINGIIGLIFLVAAVAGIATAFGVVAYDRVFAMEVRRAR